MELGVFTLTEMRTGTTATDRIRDIIEYGAHADALGLDVFGVGEHHTPRFAVASPAVVLAGIATRTSSITLTSAGAGLSAPDTPPSSSCLTQTSPGSGTADII